MADFDMEDPRCAIDDPSTHPLVTIVLAGRYKVMVPKTVLVPRSTFFTNMLADSLFISLPERFGQSLDALECYLQYIASGKICSTDPSTRETFETRGEKEYALLCKSYIFADLLEDDQCKDAIMSALLAVYRQTGEDGSHRRPSADLVKVIYASTAPGSPLRKLVVDAFIWNNTSCRLTPRNGRIPYDLVEFFSEVVNTLLRQNAATRHDAGIPSGVSCCDYHVHEDPALCTTRKRKREIADVGAAAIEESLHQDDQQTPVNTATTPAPTTATTDLTPQPTQSSPAPVAPLDTAQSLSSSTSALQQLKPTPFFIRRHSQPLFGQISTPTFTVESVEPTASQPPAGTSFGQTTDSSTGTGFARFESPAHLPPSWQRETPMV